MPDGIVFIRRQSPDWAALARDHRRGHAVAPERFVPRHAIPGFPPDIALLVDTWNRRFAIDFFTTRAILARLSTASIRAVAGSRAFRLEDLQIVAKLAETDRFLAFFHDDDDLFAPDMLARLQSTSAMAYDVCVSPLYRIHTDLFTFARETMSPEVILGRRRPCDFRFQSNNYGLHARLCRLPALRALKDHVIGSAFADRAGLRDLELPFALSATVKSPASAMQLALLVADHDRWRADLDGFVARFTRPDLPPGHGWLAAPLAIVSRLLRAVAAGDGYAAIAPFLPEDAA